MSDKKGPLRIDAMKAKKPSKKKVPTASGGSRAYDFVTQSVGGSPRVRVWNLAAPLLQPLQKKLEQVLRWEPGESAGRYAELKRAWLEKRWKLLLRRA